MDQEKLAEIRARDAAAKKDQEQADRHQELITKFDSLGQSFVKSMKVLVDFLTGVTTKVELTNQLDTVSTPDVDKVVDSLNDLKKSYDAKKIDWEPITKGLTALEAQLKKLPTKFPDIPKQAKVDFEATNTLLRELKQAVGGLNLVVEAPVVNVPKQPTPIVNVPKLDLGPLLDEMKKLNTEFSLFVIPEQIPTNTEEIEKQFDKANKYLKRLVEKPVGGGGGGGGGYVFKAHNDGGMVAPELEIDGSLPVTIKSDVGYHVTREDSASDPSYFGFETASGNWEILRITDSTGLYEYFAGTGGIASNWAGRAGYMYVDYSVAF